MDLVRSALRTVLLYPKKYFWYLCPLEADALGRIKSTKNYSNTIGNRIPDLPFCSTVPQPTASPRAPNTVAYKLHIHFFALGNVGKDRPVTGNGGTEGK
jgi:hypothetical protein